MVFTLQVSEVAEIGGIYVFLQRAPQMLSQVVIQRIRLKSETWAVLEGNLRLFSFTNHVFYPRAGTVSVHGPMPSTAQLLRE